MRRHLEEITSSHAFAGSKRTKDFLKLIVQHALAGEVDSLRERSIGAEMFGRPINYDTGTDAVVRVKATEVRKRLSQYYLEAERDPSGKAGHRPGALDAFRRRAVSSATGPDALL